MRIDILTLFPEMCERVVNESIIGRAVRFGALDIRCHSIRDHSDDRFRRTDDAPFGGGRGMLQRAEPLARACEAIAAEHETPPRVLYLSPKGETFTQRHAVRLSKLPGLVLVCGHYEGVDQRFIDALVDEELSVGDYVLTGGELAALIVADAVGRLCEGVLDEECTAEESHQNGLLEYPHYTRPAVWRGRAVPEVLLSGHHANIERWRRTQSLLLTRQRRPDLFAKAELTGQDQKALRAYEEGDG